MSKASEVARQSDFLLCSLKKKKGNLRRKPSRVGTVSSFESRKKKLPCKEHQGCVQPLTRHKDNGRFFLVSNVLILSFLSGAEIAKLAVFSTQAARPHRSALRLCSDC